MSKYDDCLKDVAAAYAQAFDYEDISDVFDQLDRARKQAEKQGSDLGELLTSKSLKIKEEVERQAYAKKLQIIHNIKAQSTLTSRILPFLENEYEEPEIKAIKSALVGTPYRIPNARNSADNGMFAKKYSFLINFMNEIDKAGGTELWNSREGEVQIANAVLEHNKGNKNLSTVEGRIADIYKKYQNRLLTARLEKGLITHKLESYVIGTVHDAVKITELSKEERTQIKADNPDASPAKLKNKIYEYTYNRWFNKIITKLDHYETFLKRDIDPTDIPELHRIMKKVYGKLVNSDKSFNKQLNLAERYNAERFLIFKDAQSIVDYNKDAGTGNIQDAMVNELGYGFAMDDLTNRFGTEPMEVLNGYFRSAHKIPEISDRIGLNKKIPQMQRLLTALMHGSGQGVDGYAGDILQSIKTYEMAQHLNLVTLKSVPDLGSLGNEASRLGMSEMDVVGNALSTFMKGLDQETKEQLSDAFDVARKTHNGTITHFFKGENNLKSLNHKAAQAVIKFNMIDRWDHSMRAACHALYGRWFAQKSHVEWDELSDKDRMNLQIYDINKLDWEVLRQSGQLIGKDKTLLTPDSVQYLDNAKVKQIMTDNGEQNVTPYKVQKMKQSIEDKWRSYVSDRVDHVIQRPTVEDKLLLNFGYQGDNKAIHFVTQLLSQFKSFSVSFTNKNLLEMLYGNGARNMSEALIGGKANYSGMREFAIRMMMWSYVAMTLSNLANGMSPPRLDNVGTWSELLQDTTGVFGRFAGNINFNDLKGSAAQMAFGPSATDIQKMVTLAKDGTTTAITGKGLSNTKKAWWGVIHQNTNFLNQAYLLWFLNSSLWNGIHDKLAPGQRHQALQHLQQETGATPYGQ